MKSDLIQSFSKPWRKDGEKTRQISINHGNDKQKTWQIFPNALFPPLRPHISRQSHIICASLETLLPNISNQEISPPCRICRNSQVLETRHVFLPARRIWKTNLFNDFDVESFGLKLVIRQISQRIHWSWCAIPLELHKHTISSRSWRSFGTFDQITSRF